MTQHKMNKLAILKGIACLSVLLGSAASLANYVTELDQAVWHAERRASRCVLEHVIHNVARARFSPGSDKRPLLTVTWHARGIQGGPAVLTVVPAPWQQLPELSLSQSQWQNQTLIFSQQVPDALTALANGRWLAITEPGNPRRIVIPSIHFQQAYSEYRRCLGTGSAEPVADDSGLILNFQSGARELSAGQQHQIAALASRINTNEPVSLLLESYTDNSGSASLNLELSRQRAEQVAAELRRFHPALPITIRAFGEAYPLAENTTPAGRYQNRRLVISLLKVEKAS